MSLLQSVRQIKHAALVLALSAAAAVTSPTSAQFGEAMGITRLMAPEYLRRDLVIFEQGLQLDEAQRLIADAMFNEYELQITQGVENMRQRFEDLRPELAGASEGDVMKLVFRPFKEWAAERENLNQQFLENIKVLLTPEQLERWPAFERRLFREKKLVDGRLSGESINLFDIVRDMHLSPQVRAQIEPILDEYSIQLDEALRRREAITAGPANQMLLALEAQDSQKTLAAYQSLIDRRVQVRNINDTYIDLIADALPSDLGMELRRNALERGYPRVFRTTPVQRIFAAAKELPDLEPGILQAIIAIEAGYLSELEDLNQILLNAVRQYEPVEQRHQAEAVANRMAGRQTSKPDDPTKDLFLRRDNLSRDYTRQLHALLTPEQFAQLPGGYRWIEEPTRQPQVVSPPVPKQVGPKGGSLDRKPDQRELPPDSNLGPGMR